MNRRFISLLVFSLFLGVCWIPRLEGQEQNPCLAVEDPSETCRQFCENHLDDPSCKIYCELWPEEPVCGVICARYVGDPAIGARCNEPAQRNTPFCAGYCVCHPDVCGEGGDRRRPDCNILPEDPNRSNYCSVARDSQEDCRLYCACHPQACSDPPPPDCSQIERQSRQSQYCHDYRSTAICHAYCRCYPNDCDQPPIDCGDFPADPNHSNYCSGARQQADCQRYCSCHPQDCDQPPPPDCSTIRRHDTTDRLCHDIPASYPQCVAYCRCYPSGCENPQLDCRNYPEEANVSLYCSSPEARQGDMDCQLYCECHPQACAQPPPPDCSHVQRTNGDDRRCHDRPNSSSCRVYCQCYPEGCASSPPEPPNCEAERVTGRAERRQRSLLCSADPFFDGCPDYCFCFPDECDEEDRPIPDELCEVYPGHPACVCRLSENQDRVAFCKQYCTAHPLACNVGSPSIPEVNLVVSYCLSHPMNCSSVVFSSPFSSFCKRYPTACYPKLVDQIMGRCWKVMDSLLCQQLLRRGTPAFSQKTKVLRRGKSPEKKARKKRKL